MDRDVKVVCPTCTGLGCFECKSKGFILATRWVDVNAPAEVNSNHLAATSSISLQELDALVKIGNHLLDEIERDKGGEV